MVLRRLLGRRERAERALGILGNNIIMLEERPMPLHAFSLLRTAPTSSRLGNSLAIAAYRQDCHMDIWRGHDSKLPRRGSISGACGRQEHDHRRRERCNALARTCRGHARALLGHSKIQCLALYRNEFHFSSSASCLRFPDFTFSLFPIVSSTNEASLFFQTPEDVAHVPAESAYV